MEKQGKSRKPLIIGIVAAVVILAVLLVLLLTQCTGSQGTATTAPGTTEASVEETPTYQLYWNLDRAEYDGKSEAGMSSRMPEEDGFFHVRLFLDGEEIVVKVQDRRVINSMDVNDLMGLEFDENGIVVGVIPLSDLPLEKVAWQFYVQSAGSTLIKANSSDTFGGMEVQLELDNAKGVWDMTGKSGPVGCEATPIELDRIYAVKNMAGEVTHVFIYERVNYMLTHEGECQHCEKTVTWYEWVREDKLPTSTGHYQLQNDIQLSAQQSFVNQDQKVCLDLNGKRVDGKSGARVYSLHNAGASLAIMDTSEGQTGVLAAHGTGDQGMVVWVRYGQLHLYAGTLDGSDASTKVYGTTVTVPKNTYFYMHGGTIIGGTAKYGQNSETGKYTRGYGGTMYVGGKFVMNDGVIRDGFAQSATYWSNGTQTTTRGYGGNLFIGSGGVVEINGGTIKNGKAGSNGGNIYMDGTAELTMNGGSISGGKITGKGKNGGSIYITTKSTFTLNGGSISGGSCYNAGGNIYLNGAFVMNGGSVSGGKCYNYTTRKLNEECTNYNVFVVNGRFQMYGGRIYGGVGVTDTSTTDAKQAAVHLSAYATIKSDKEGTTNLTINTGGNPKVSVGTLRDSASIGVNTSRGIFTTPTKEENKDNFFSDIPEAEILYYQECLALGRLNCVCGKDDTHINGCDGTEYLWAPWISKSSAPKSNGNYFLIHNVTTTGQTLVSKGHTVRVDLNGFDIVYDVAPTSSDGFRVYRSQFESLLVITDTTDQPGAIRSDMPSEAEVLAAVQAKLDDGTYDEAKADKIIAGQKKGNFGQVLWARGGDIVVHNGILDGSNLNGTTYGMTVCVGANTASDDGGVTRKGSFTMYGGTIKGATSASYGCSLYGSSNSVLNIHGGIIEGGETTANAGGNVYVLGEFLMDGGIIRDGVAYSSGGNLVVDGSKANAVITGNAQILNGKAGDPTLEKDIGRGGNIRVVTKGAQLTLSGNAVVSGGMVYRSASDKGGYGGNISVNTDTVMNMTGGTVENGVSQYRSGNIDVCGVLNISGGTITGGKAKYGGNIYVLNGEGRELNMTGGLIEKGHATSTGGNIQTLAPTTITGGVIAEGKAALDSGAPSTNNLGGNIYACSELNIGGDAIIRDGYSGCYGGNISLYVDGSLEGYATVYGNAQILNGVADAQKKDAFDGGYGGNIRAVSNTTLIVKDNALIAGGEVIGGKYNSTSKKGGGGQGGNIYMINADVQLLGGVIENGTANGGGGNIGANSPSGTLLLQDVTIRGGDTGTSYGGNIRLRNGMGQMTVTGKTQILNGTASVGGNIYIDGTAAANVQIGGETLVAGGNVGATENGPNIYMGAMAYLTITDNAVVDAADSIGKRGGAVYMGSANATFTMEGNAKLIGTDDDAMTHGGAAYVRANVTIGGNAQIIAGDGADYGNAVYFHSGTMTVKENALIDAANTTATYGNAIYGYTAGAKLTISGDAVVKGGTATTSGAAIYAVCDLSVSDNVKIVGGTATTSGGAVYLTGDMTMTGGTIVGGYARYGGNVYVYSGASFAMSGGVIVGGQASRGGNVVVESNAYAASFTMTGGTISGGEAYIRGTSNGQGGNLWLYNNKTAQSEALIEGGIIGGKVTVDGTEYAGGHSTGNGGNIYSATNTVVTLKNAQLMDGVAGLGSGGNIYTTGVVVMENTTVTGGINGIDYTESSDKPNGGSIYVSNSASLTMTGGSVTGGKTINTGGNFVVYGDFFMNGGTISGGAKINNKGEVTSTIASNANVYLVNGNMTMNGGSIDGRVALYGDSFLTLSGDVNLHTEDEVDGDVLLNGTTEPITINGSLGEERIIASIRLNDCTNVISAETVSGNEKYFRSSVEGETVFFNGDNKLEIGKLGCICGSTDGTHIGDCDGTEHLWKAWSDTASAPTEDGYWYLTDDINITGKYTGRLMAKSTVAIDLNGHTINYGGNSGYRLYTTYSGGHQNDVHLIFTDRSADHDGKIIGTNQTKSHNGPIVWLSCARTTLSVYRITIDGSKMRTLHTGEVLGSDEGPKYGAVLAASGSSSKINLFDATILGGTSEHGDAISVNGENAILRLEGDVTITGTEGDAIYWRSKQPIDITKLNSLNDGVCIYGEGTFTKGFTGDTVKWFTTTENRVIEIREGELHLAQYHCICDMPDGKHVEGFCDGTKYVWEPWTDTAKAPSASGYYYLTGDVTTASYNSLTTERTIYIDLNGFDINSSASRLYTTQNSSDRTPAVHIVLTNTKTGDESSIKVTGNGDQGRIVWISGYNKSLKVYNLTVDVSEATTAVNGLAFSINSQTETKTGVSASVEVYNTVFNGPTKTSGGIGNVISITKTAGLGQSLKLKDVTFNGGYSYQKKSGGNTAISGGALYLSGGDVYMENVTVNGAEAGINGGAVYLGSHAALTLTGKIDLSGNIDGNGEPSGVHVTAGATVDVADLAEGSVIGISGDEGVISADTYKESDPDLTYLTADHDDQYLLLVNGKLNLKGKSCICGMPEGEHVAGFCDGTLLSWKPWTDATKAPDVEGNWFLTADLTIAGTAYLYKEDVKINLDLNGHTITVRNVGTSASRLYSTYWDAANDTSVNLKFTNLSADPATIKVVGAGDEGRVAWLTGTNKSMSMYNVGIDLSEATTRTNGDVNVRKDGIAINVAGTGNSLKMFDCSVIGGNTASTGGVLAVLNGNSATLTRCTVTGGSVKTGYKDNSTTSGGYGGFLYVRGNVTLNSCTIQNVYAQKGSGAIYVYGTNDTTRASLTMNGCTIEGCSAGGNAGAVNVEAYGDAVINNCVIKNCSSVGRAGAIHVNTGCSAELNKTTITGCTVTGKSRGGAIYNYQGELKLIGCTITGNSTTDNSPLGGGVYLYGADMTVGGKTVISGNKADTAESNIYLNGRKILVDAENPLTSDSSIGVFSNAGVVISEDVKYADKGIFTSDKSALQVIHDGTLKLANAGHWHCVCAGQPTGDPNHVCKDIEFTAIDALAGGSKLASGNYYLTGDTTVSGTSYVGFEANATVNFCVAGHTVSGNDKHRVFFAGSDVPGVTFTLTTCGTNADGSAKGTVKNASQRESNILGFYEATSVFNLYNVTLDASECSYTSKNWGSVINNKSTFNMYSGTIIGSASADNMAATGNVSVGAGSVMNMYGGTITGGTCASSNASAGNVYVSGTLNMMGGTITGGKIGTNANSYIANMQVVASGVLNMSGGVIDGHVYAGKAGATVNLSGTAKILDADNRSLWIIPGNTNLFIGEMAEGAQINVLVKDASDKDTTGVFASGLNDYKITEADLAYFKVTNTSGVQVANVALNDDNTVSAVEMN